MSNNLLKIEKLVTHFEITNGIFGRTTGIVHAVDDISFDINKAETLSIVGESGVHYCHNHGQTRNHFLSFCA
mgnify:CR=1 FL=1